MSKHTSTEVNREFVRHVGGHVLAVQLAGQRDPASITGDHLDKLADLSVRAALALDGAIPRAEERLAAEAKAVEDAAAAAAAAEKQQAAAVAAAEKQQVADDKAAVATEKADAKQAAADHLKPPFRK